MTVKAQLQRCLRWGEHLLAVIGGAFLVFACGFDLIVMMSPSMAPTLKGTSEENGDRVLVERVSSWFREPRRWEVYHYHDDDGTPVAKRVVGLPGERIAILDSKILINGQELERPPHLRDNPYYGVGLLANGRAHPCEAGYFMLGDDSRDSYDSRFTGTVKAEQFHGRAWCILAPWNRMGFVR